MKKAKTISKLQQLLRHLLSLRQEVYTEGMATFLRWHPQIRRKSFLFSGLNLAFYLALRRRDLRELQRELMYWGLSSLGRSEARTVTNLDSVIVSLSRICGGDLPPEIDYPGQRAFFRGDWLINHNSKAIFGKTFSNSRVRIMVTLPTEAATNYQLICKLLAQGMNIARINCAHDNREKWQGMIDNIRQAENEFGYSCQIYIDLAGPKLRITQISTTAPDNKVSAGETFFLTRNGMPCQNSQQCISVSVSLPEVFASLRPGCIVMVDDGGISGVVESVNEDGAIVRVTGTGGKSKRLQPQKGLNFPGTALMVAPLTPKDLEDLDFIAEQADAIGYSFVKHAGDILLLQQELERRIGPKAHTIPLVAKIETTEAIENLPEIIVQAASRQPFAIMIARGDLAIEVGYARLAELQEEILWIAEAAHVPVIWATQVLETLIKQGVPTRAEVTDAAMAVRAECVMLNKGPFLPEAISFLDDIRGRMQSHQYKKTAQLRSLSIAGDHKPVYF